MKIHQLRTLVAISDTGSVRNAAKALELSPAAVTKAMRELEAQVGVALIVREASGISLTEAGRALLAHARLMIQQLRRAQDEMDRFSGAGRERLTVALPTWVASALLGGIMKRFEQEMPDTRLVFYESLLSVAVPKLRDGTLDLSVNRACPPSCRDEFQQVRLFLVSYAVVGRAGHPLAKCRTLPQLKGASWVLNRDFTENDAEGDGPFGEYFRRYKPRVHVAHSSSMMIGLICNTDVLSIMPWPLAELLVAKEGLCVLPVTETIPDVEVNLMYRRATPLSAAAKVFIQSLKDTILDEANATDPMSRRVFHAVECVLSQP
ncbi:HTH-type transcriptional regulator TsaR [Paraburkholderia nemoris]|uniref:LysR family transcriptional regulator n=1 Tax=Paraburkholderia nemoris TaxID=2793076 RepID=UPI00191426AC|nr:LysR family transcriptional regulator [Paraburkholderia nemoris]MBK5153010.1 LysR family transcriptional regulator [Burkholderia sp. R-69608]CAE6971299.1 HTH-type transcriptional regulator TsaR [Paraburkholderia nemoris]